MAQQPFNADRYDAFLFDWDGTLGRTIELLIEIFYTHGQSYGLTASRKDIALNFGDWRAPLKFGLSEDMLEQFKNEARQKITPKLAKVDLYDGAAELLQELTDSDKKLALVTSAYHEVVDLVLGYHGLRHSFEVVVTAGDVTAHKPDPEGILYALDRLNVAKEKAIMLGDSDKDLLAAANAGVDSLLFYPESHQLIYNLERLKTHNPTYIISSWRELLEEQQ